MKTSHLCFRVDGKRVSVSTLNYAHFNPSAPTPQNGQAH